MRGRPASGAVAAGLALGLSSTGCEPDCGGIREPTCHHIDLPEVPDPSDTGTAQRQDSMLAVQVYEMSVETVSAADGREWAAGRQLWRVSNYAATYCEAIVSLYGEVAPVPSTCPDCAWSFAVTSAATIEYDGNYCDQLRWPIETATPGEAFELAFNPHYASDYYGDRAVWLRAPARTQDWYVWAYVTGDADYSSTESIYGYYTWWR